MKKQIISIMLSCIALSSHGQIVNFTVIKANEEMTQKINSTKKQIFTSLCRTGFTNEDTISILFNYRMEYTVVRHNIKDPDKIENLFRNIILHASLLRNTVIANSKFMHFKIYVQSSEKDRYLFSDSEDLSLTPIMTRMPDIEFKKYEK